MGFGQSLTASPAVWSAPDDGVAEGVAEWQQGLPTLTGPSMRLRELQLSDAESLCELLTTDDVSRFISPPAPTVAAFEQFIVWMHHQRRAGAFACFAAALRGSDTAVGIFQVHRLDRTFDRAEWGFALGRPVWGTGVFGQGATLLLDFVFDVIGVQRLEARAVCDNVRANRALRRCGAVEERILHHSLERHGILLDQALWVINAEERRRKGLQIASVPPPPAH